jgi:hypothetical protein
MSPELPTVPLGRRAVRHQTRRRRLARRLRDARWDWHMAWEFALERLPPFTQRTMVLLVGVLAATLALVGGLVSLAQPEPPPRDRPEILIGKPTGPQTTATKPSATQATSSVPPTGTTSPQRSTQAANPQGGTVAAGSPTASAPRAATVRRQPTASAPRSATTPKQPATSSAGTSTGGSSTPTTQPPPPPDPGVLDPVEELVDPILGG